MAKEGCTPLAAASPDKRHIITKNIPNGDGFLVVAILNILHIATKRSRFNGSLWDADDDRARYKAEERFYKTIADKHAQVERLLDDHKDPNDPLQLRLKFVECTANHKLGEMLRRHSTERGHGLSVIADMKRRTPTKHHTLDNSVLSFLDASDVAKSMAAVGFDVIFVNTDETVYGGHISELHDCFLELRKLGRRVRPAIVMKDIVLHPIQIAQAAEYRADGVLLNALVLGTALKEMIIACLNMGIEPVVEIHTKAEAMLALEFGANNLLVNQWDRVHNLLKPTRALEIKNIVGDDATLIAAGGIINFTQVHELALMGYDAIVLGRRLSYDDIPEFVERVRQWQSPCKSILRLSRDMFFDIQEDEEGIEGRIRLKGNHEKLLNEMNAFYGRRGVNASNIQANTDSDAHKVEPAHQQPIENDRNRNGGADMDDKIVTVTYGNPVNTTFVKNILSTVECPESMIDTGQYLAERKSEMYRMKWYVERQRWIKRFRHHFHNRRDANNAHRLKKAIDMYTAFRLYGTKLLKSKKSNIIVEKMGQILRQHVKAAYEEAPRDNLGNIIMPRPE
ncbi:anthranilate synthase component II [Babesia ovata]|uniref:indole-3-glycerol-phosphate synthase n=1 Tax=Babesia ovata TaxID=189622 RepID=A0A2H6KEL3_9APIC|nr:anthranilate synthase component II [Babesia ovata]GBE61438.1 anthranilate synthase component II [Babesia ovata]